MGRTRSEPDEDPAAGMDPVMQFGLKPRLD